MILVLLHGVRLNVSRTTISIIFLSHKLIVGSKLFFHFTLKFHVLPKVSYASNASNIKRTNFQSEIQKKSSVI